MPDVFMADLAGMQAWAEGLMASRPADFVIGDDYLRRWWVLPRNEFSNVYLHDIRKSDDDRAFHDHPWQNTSVLLFGSYIEHTPDGTFVRKAGDVIQREAGSLHRLEVIPGERAISLFMTGPKVRAWGFDCGHGWVHWKDFTSEDDSSQIGRGCGEGDDLSPVTPIGQERASTHPNPAESWLRRVKLEHAELDTKLSALNDFIDTDPFNRLDVDSRASLRAQQGAMSDYLAILAQRIAKATADSGD